MSRHDDHITYQSVRRWPRRGLYSRLAIAVGEVIEPTALEVWLTARRARTPARPAGLGGYRTSTDRGRCVRRRSSS